MRPVLIAALLLGVAAEAKPREPQFSTASPPRKPPRPSDGQMDMPAATDSVSTSLLALTGEHKVEVLMDRCDDECHLLVNGSERATASASATPAWVDISGDVRTFHRNGLLALVVMNSAQGWSYRFQIRVDGKLIWRDECGVPTRNGCEHNDQRQGVVREIEVHF
jgi:hypothetical protein